MRATIQRAGRMLALILSAALLAVSFAGCNTKKTAAEMDVLDLPEDLDPQTTTDAAAELILCNVMEGLTRINSAGAPVLAAAERYTCSADGLTYTFTLKESKWSDGVAVTAADFVYALQRLFTKATGAAAQAAKLSAIENSEKVLNGQLPVEKLGVSADGNKLILRLSRKEPDLLLLLADKSACPCRKDFFESTKGSYGLSRTDLIYNGPYVIRYWLADSYIVLSANEEYGGTEPVCTNVTINLAADAAAILANFQAKTTNLCRTGQVSENDGKYESLAFEDTVYCLAMQTKSGLLSDDRLRAALTGCVADGLFPRENTAGYRPVTALLPAALTTRPQEPAYTENDAAAARKQLSACLKANGLEKLGALSLLIPKSGAHREMLTALQQNWQKELGIYVNLEIVADDDWKTRLANGDYTMALLPVTATADSCKNVLEQLGGNGALNQFGFSSAAYDELLAQAEKESAAAQKETYGRCCALLAEARVLLPVYAAPSLYYYDKDLHGIEISPFGSGIYFATAGMAQEA